MTLPSRGGGRKFGSLYDLLHDASINDLIPPSVRKGGMNIKYVQSTDDTYVQYLLKEQNWSIDTSDWDKINVKNDLDTISSDLYILNSKIYGDEIEDIKEEDVIQRYIDSTLKWSSGNYSFIIFVGNLVGRHLSSTGVVQYAIIKSNDSTLNTYADAYNGRQNGNLSNVEIPAGYPYLYLYVGTTLSLPTLTINDKEDGLDKNVSDLQDQVTTIHLDVQGAMNTANDAKNDASTVKSEIDALAEIGEDIEVTINRYSSIISEYTDKGYPDKANGNWTANSAYTSYKFVVPSDMSIYIIETSGKSNCYLQAVLFDEEIDMSTSSIVTKPHVIKSGRKTSTEDTLPTSSSRWDVSTGQMIVLSINTSKGSDFAIKYNEAADYYVMTDKFMLGYSQIENIKDAIEGGGCIINYDGNCTTGQVYGKQQFSVYIPATIGFVKYVFVRCEAEAKNANNWRIDRAYACDSSKNERFPITSNGEWEMAIHKADASVDDFMGGIAHGDEVFNSLNVYINGLKISNIETINNQKFTDLKIVETTDMYDPDYAATLSTRDQFTPVASHGKEYHFTIEGLELKQFVEWKSAMTIQGSYMAMFPIIRIIRDVDTPDSSLVGMQITDTVYTNRDYIEYDVSTLDASPIMGIWQRNVTDARIYSNSSGVSACVEMLLQPDIENDGSKKFELQNSLSYNKLYWALCAVGGAGPYAAAKNERFVTTIMYKIDVAK